MLKSLHTDQNAEFLSMLRGLRCKRRLRQSDMARLLGKSQATVSKVEQGTRRLDLMELRQWLVVLDVDFLDFMNELSGRLASVLATWPDHRITQEAGKESPACLASESAVNCGDRGPQPPT